MKTMLRGDADFRVIDVNFREQTRPPVFPYGRILPVVLELYHDDNTAYDEAELNQFTTWQFGVDSDYLFSTEPAVLTISDFVVTGNTIAFVARTDTIRFKDILGNKATTSGIAELKGYLPGETLSSFGAQFKVQLRNAVVADGSAPPPANPDLYYTAAQVQSLLLNKVDNSFSGYTEKAALVDADTAVLNDSEDSGSVKRFSLLNLWNFIKSKADAVYSAVVHSHAIADVTDLQSSLDAKQNALGFTPEDSANKGAANGYAELDTAGKVPSAQLPAYVDDVLEYADFASLPATGESGKIYITLDDNKTYRWSGSAYVEISSSLALGETESTAHRGDHGKTAYDHSQLTTGNPHVVTKTEVGLGNVANTLNNYSATVAPTGNDDSSAGYSVGSKWIDTTNGNTFSCTSAAVGAAAWEQENAGLAYSAGAAVDITDTTISVDISKQSAASAFEDADKILIEKADGTLKYILKTDLPGASSGEANTASNTGTSGVGIFKQKTGVDLELYKILGSDGISISLNGTDHVDAKLSFSDMTEESSPATTALVAVETASGMRKVQLENLPGGGGLQNNLTATSNPSASNDNTEGYAVGSRWLNTSTNEAFECLDAATGAANWKAKDIHKLASMDAESFRYPKTGVATPFTNASNSVNIEFDADNYSMEAALLSTSQREPMQFPAFTIPSGVKYLLFRIRFSPESGQSFDNTKTVTWKFQYKTWNLSGNPNILTDQLIKAVFPSGSGMYQINEIVSYSESSRLHQAVLYVDTASTWTYDVAFHHAEIWGI